MSCYQNVNVELTLNYLRIIKFSIVEVTVYRPQPASVHVVLRKFAKTEYTTLLEKFLILFNELDIHIQRSPRVSFVT